jgi:Tfp pilus assembly protein PilO
MYMSLVTLIVIVVVVLAIVGLGWNVFVSGVYKGAEKIMGNMNNSVLIKNLTKKAEQLINGLTTNRTYEQIPGIHDRLSTSNV